MAIAGTTTIGAMIAPNNEKSSIAIQSEKWNKGGYRSVATVLDRDAILNTKRWAPGMLVNVLSENIVYKLVPYLDFNWMSELASDWHFVPFLSSTEKDKINAYLTALAADERYASKNELDDLRNEFIEAKLGKEDIATKIRESEEFIALRNKVDELETKPSPTTEYPEPVQGPQGPQGPAGEQGPQGIQGFPGKSAFDIAVENGFIGTEQDWLRSLKGEKGNDGYPVQMEMPSLKTINGENIVGEGNITISNPAIETKLNDVIVAINKLLSDLGIEDLQPIELLSIVTPVNDKEDESESGSSQSSDNENPSSTDGESSEENMGEDKKEDQEVITPGDNDGDNTDPETEPTSGEDLPGEGETTEEQESTSGETPTDPEHPVEGEQENPVPPAVVTDPVEGEDSEQTEVDDPSDGESESGNTETEPATGDESETKPVEPETEVTPSDESETTDTEPSEGEVDETADKGEEEPAVSTPKYSYWGILPSDTPTADDITTLSSKQQLASLTGVELEMGDPDNDGYVAFACPSEIAGSVTFYNRENSFTVVPWKTGTVEIDGISYNYYVFEFNFESLLYGIR